MLRKKLPELLVCVVYIWKGHAYIPVQDQYESGIFVGSEPVFISTLNIEDLAKAIQMAKEMGHKKIPDPKTRDEFLTRKDPILTVTGARNWKQLAKAGIAYTIGWSAYEVRIDMSRCDNKGRWEFDPGKTIKMLPVTPIEQICMIILEDLNTRPEIGRS
jgi:hypothetical protein